MSPDALTGMEANLRFVVQKLLKPKSLVVYLLGRTGYFNARMLLVPTGLSRRLVNQHRRSLRKNLDGINYKKRFQTTSFKQ